MAVQDGSNRVWHGEKGPLFYIYSFLALQVCRAKGWEVQETQRFVVIVSVLTLLIANDKMLNKTYLQALQYLHFVFGQVKCLLLLYKRLLAITLPQSSLAVTGDAFATRALLKYHIAPLSFGCSLLSLLLQPIPWPSRKLRYVLGIFTDRSMLATVISRENFYCFYFMYMSNGFLQNFQYR